jgi:hypothetical protein
MAWTFCARAPSGLRLAPAAASHVVDPTEKDESIVPGGAPSVLWLSCFEPYG